jgi:dienelactone hydrolase
MDPFEYKQSMDDFKLALRRFGHRWDLYDACFKSAANPRLIGTDTVPAEYYHPKAPDSVPLVILLHGMGDTSLAPPRLLAKSLAAGGFACFIPRLVVHSTRTPKMRNRSKSLSPDEWFDAYRASVIEVRQIIDWAQKKGELDSKRIAILGISFGAFVAALAMGVEKRISAGVLIEGGGNSVKINKLSRAMRTRYPGPVLDHEKLLKEYEGYLNQVENQGLESVTPSQRSFLTDPLTYSSSIKTRPLLMINALGDELIPREAALDLWKATGNQAMLWLLGTHITLWLWYPVIRRRIKAFLNSVFRNRK